MSMETLTLQISERADQLARQAERDVAEQFARIDAQNGDIPGSGGLRGMDNGPVAPNSQQNLAVRQSLFRGDG